MWNTIIIIILCSFKIEEQILECLAWSHDSPLWMSIQQAGSVPSCEDVSIPNQLETGHSTQSLLASPIIHPRVQRICGEEGAARRGKRRYFFLHCNFNIEFEGNSLFMKKTDGRQTLNSLSITEHFVDDETLNTTRDVSRFSNLGILWTPFWKIWRSIAKF